jgi:hypothetical protein
VLALVGVVAASSSCPTTQLYGTYTVTPSSLTTGQVSRFGAQSQVSFANPSFAEIHCCEQLHMLKRASVPGQAQVHRLLHRGCKQSPRRVDVPNSAHRPAGDRRIQLDGQLTQRLSAMLVVTHAHTLQLPEGYWATGQVNYTLRALVTYPDPGHAGLIDTRPYDAVPLQIAGN